VFLVQRLRGCDARAGLPRFGCIYDMAQLQESRRIHSPVVVAAILHFAVRVLCALAYIHQNILPVPWQLFRWDLSFILYEELPTAGIGSIM